MKNLSVVLLMLLMTGCATTKMQTHIDPEHKDRTYTKILVDAPNANFEFKDLMITELCSELRERSVGCVTKDELFPPTREYSEPRIFEIIDQNAVDGWLIVGIGSGAAYSRPRLPLIPDEACHPFHAKAATDSTAKLPPWQAA